MKPSKILRKAAALVASGHASVCCYAIDLALGECESELYWDCHDAFRSLLTPATVAHLTWWPDKTPESQLQRYAALLLCAEILESEGK